MRKRRRAKREEPKTNERTVLRSPMGRNEGGGGSGGGFEFCIASWSVTSL